MTTLLFSTSLDSVPDQIYTSVDVVNTYEKPQREEWQDDAACASIGPHIFFPDKKGQQYTEAKKVCGTCDVRAECLAYIMRLEADYAPSSRDGMFGGKTPTQRYNLYKKSKAQQEASQESQTL